MIRTCLGDGEWSLDLSRQLSSWFDIFSEYLTHSSNFSLWIFSRSSFCFLVSVDLNGPTNHRPTQQAPTNQKPLPLYAIVFPKLFLFFDRFWTKRTEEGKRNFHFVYNHFLEIVIDFGGKIGSFIIFLENIFLPLVLIKNKFLS